MVEHTLGVIGGSGLYELPGLEAVERVRVTAVSDTRASSSCPATAAAIASSPPRSTSAPTSMG